MKATELRVKKSCRDKFGVEEAWKAASAYLHNYYKFLLESEENKDKTIRFEIHID